MNSTPQTETPRTDEATAKPIKIIGVNVFDCGLVTADYARQLERELNEARREIMMLSIDGTNKDELHRKQLTQSQAAAQKYAQQIQSLVELLGLSPSCHFEGLTDEIKFLMRTQIDCAAMREALESDALWCFTGVNKPIELEARYAKGGSLTSGPNNCARAYELINKALLTPSGKELLESKKLTEQQWHRAEQEIETLRAKLTELMGIAEDCELKFRKFLANKKPVHSGIAPQTIGCESWSLKFTGSQQGEVEDSFAKLTTFKQGLK